MKITPCPNCRGKSLYKSNQVSAGGGHAPNYLPTLGKGWGSAKFEVVLCRDCGLTRFFASQEAAQKVSGSKKWTRVVPSN